MNLFTRRSHFPTEQNRESGAGMVEYVLLVAFIGLMLIGAIGFLTGALQGSLSTAGSAF